MSNSPTTEFFRMGQLKEGHIAFQFGNIVHQRVGVREFIIFEDHVRCSCFLASFLFETEFASKSGISASSASVDPDGLVENV